MPATGYRPIPRRNFLAGAVAAGLLTWPGVGLAQIAASNPADGAVDAVRRLLVLASQNAFVRLTAPEGFWKSRVARFGLPVLFRKTGGNAAGPLGSNAFREQLQHRLNILAETGARGAAPVVADGARRLAVGDPLAILRGKPTAATSQLRLEMASQVVDAMIPPLEQAIVTAADPIVAQAVAQLVGVKPFDVAKAIALGADNGTWYEIGLAEAAIRANPALTNDPVLIAALRPA
jgi:hypothetical protein